MTITNIMQHWKYLGGMSLQTILKEPLENIQYMFVCVLIKIRRGQHMTVKYGLFSQSHTQITESSRGQFSVPQGSSEDILVFSKCAYLHFPFHQNLASGNSGPVYLPPLYLCLTKHMQSFTIFFRKQLDQHWRLPGRMFTVSQRASQAAGAR